MGQADYAGVDDDVAQHVTKRIFHAGTQLQCSFIYIMQFRTMWDVLFICMRALLTITLRLHTWFLIFINACHL